MKKISIYIGLAVLLFSTVAACQVSIFKSVKGNKNVIVKERKVSNKFNKIQSRKGLNVYITMAKETSVVVEADENLHEIIKTVVEDGVLKIYSDENIRRAKAKNIYIKTPRINAIDAESGSSIIFENTMIVNNFEAKSSSGASAELLVNSEIINSKCSSGASMSIKGKAFSHESDASSGASINAFELKSNEVIARVSSGAHIKIFAKDKLTAKASSGGSINYEGRPLVLEKKSSSGGSVYGK